MAGVSVFFCDAVAVTATIVAFIGQVTGNSAQAHADGLSALQVVKLAKITKDALPMRAAVEGTVGPAVAGEHVPVPGYAGKDVLVWEEKESLELLKVKDGAQQTAMESVGTKRTGVDLALAQGGTSVALHASLPRAPLQELQAPRRVPLTPADMERLSTVEYREARDRRGRPTGRREAVRTATAIASQFSDLALKAGTLLTVIGTLRVAADGRVELAAGGGFVSVGTQDLASLIANARSNADGGRWLARTAGGVAALAAAASVGLRLYNWYTAVQEAGAGAGEGGDGAPPPGATSSSEGSSSGAAPQGDADGPPRDPQ